MSEPTVRLLLSCPDRRGLVAAVADFVYQRGGDIIQADQHTDETAKLFLQRVEFRLPDPGRVDRAVLAGEVDDMAQRFDMSARVRWSDEERRYAVLASRQPHCLYDLLSRHHAGELPGTLALVASNHADHAAITTNLGIPFHHVPIGDGPDAKQVQETQLSKLLTEADVELVVMARYMQILSAEFVEAWPGKIINIHHSFLPAFVGARPYHQAYERGVKIIGATAHYATADLDQGPIIEQDVVRVTHRDNAAALVAAGRDIETVVLARAVRWHLDDRIIVYGNKTVVFN